MNRWWIVVATIASVLAVILIIGVLVKTVLEAGRTAERAEARLVIQEQLLAEISTQGERLERQADTIKRLNELLVTMGEEQLVLLEKVDIQTETVEQLVTEIEMLQRETLVEVTDLQFELVEVPGEPGRIEVITEKEVVEIPVPPLPPPDDESEPEPEPDTPGRDCDEMPPSSNRKHCQ